MRYPVLTRSDTEINARRLVAGDPAPNWELVRKWVGSGHEVDLGPLHDAMERMKTAVANDDRSTATTPEGFEGRFAGEVHVALRDLPVEALDDPGFWRYLSLVEFWWFVEIREAGPLSRGNVMTYVGGGNECVPLRMFLRAQSTRSGDDYSLAGALPKSADFWRSHILRVRTGTAPPLARSFARLQQEKALVSDDVRPFARRVNRLWSNVVFHTWDEAECDELLVELYDEMFGSPDPEMVPPILDA